MKNGIQKCAEEIISSLEKQLKKINVSTCKTILRYGTYCNPIYEKGKYKSPSKKTRKQWGDLCSLLHPEFVRNHHEKEAVIMKIVYSHFYKDDKNYKFNGSYWAAGFIEDLIVSKVKNKNCIKTW